MMKRFDYMTDLCTCDEIGGTSHCFQSREYIDSASGEGFAHLVGSALYNDRAVTSWFGYYKNIYRSPTWTEVAPVWKNMSSQQHWVQSNCAPAAADFGGLGSEWDWTQFLWQLWGETNNGRFN
jgi:hypothetical protein